MVKRMREDSACMVDMLSRCGFCENIRDERECFTGFMDMLLAGPSAMQWLDGLSGSVCRACKWNWLINRLQSKCL